MIIEDTSSPKQMSGSSANRTSAGRGTFKTALINVSGNASRRTYAAYVCPLRAAAQSSVITVGGDVAVGAGAHARTHTLTNLMQLVLHVMRSLRPHYMKFNTPHGNMHTHTYRTAAAYLMSTQHR